VVMVGWCWCCGEVVVGDGCRLLVVRCLRDLGVTCGRFITTTLLMVRRRCCSGEVLRC
jgi:hypothetical protein